MFGDLSPPDRPRAAIRAQLLALGTPRPNVDAIVDIACQAADNAFRAAMHTIDLLRDDRERITAIGLVWSLVAADAARGLEALKHAADDSGLKSGSFTIRSAPNG